MRFDPLLSYPWVQQQRSEGGYSKRLLLMLLLLLLASCIDAVLQKKHFLVVSLLNSGDSSHDYFLLSNGVARQIKNITQASHLGVETLEDIPPIDYDILQMFHSGLPITSTFTPTQSTDSYDKKIQRWFLGIKSMQAENLVTDFAKFCTSCKNPSYSIWNSYGLVVTERRDVAYVLSFSWAELKPANLYQPPPPSLSAEKRSSGTSTPYLGMTTSFGSVQGYDNVISGIDARIIVLSDEKALVFYSGGYGGMNIRTSVLELCRNLSKPMSQPVAISNIRKINYWQEANEGDKPPYNNNQKNWSPFIYNSSIYLIQKINPMHVVEAVPSLENSAESNSVTISRVAEIETHWKYGWLRGGTNAILIDQDRYLSFFHSRSAEVVPGEADVYFFGAFTFTSQPPFRLLQMSRFPIVEDFFFEGPHFSPQTSFVLYPTSITLESRDVIILSLGFQDSEGYVCRVSLSTLLTTLINV